MSLPLPRPVIRTAIGFAAALALGLVILKPLTLRAQATSGPSGTFACLTNKNTAGYVSKFTGSEAGVNQLFVITFNDSTATVSGLIVNKVTQFETTNSVTVPSTSTSGPTFTVTANDPAQYLYKLTDPQDTVKPIYVAMANGGNTLLALGAPSSVPSATLNGVCQKV